jgi:pimeloyl-ACP methyl ester carboxylesterase
MLVLLPGLDGTGLLFTEFVKALGGNVACQVVAYPKDRPLGYAELAHLVLEALPSGRRYVLLGESFSGPLAIRIAARKPPGLIGLILSVTFAKNPYPALRWARHLAAFMPVKSLPRWLRAPLMWGGASPSRAPPAAKRAMAGVSAAVIRHRIAALLAVDETAALGQLRLPTCVLRATRDRVISLRATLSIMQTLPSARLVEIDGPHLLLQSRPAECAAIVEEFMHRAAAIS